MATESDIFSRNIQPQCLALDDNICKREKFLKKLIHTLTHEIFSLICHSEQDFTRTNTTEQYKLGGCVRRLFLVSTGVSTMSGGSKFPWFNESRCHKNKQIMTPGFRNFIRNIYIYFFFFPRFPLVQMGWLLGGNFREPTV